VVGEEGKMRKRIVPLLGWYLGIVLCFSMLSAAVVLIEELTGWQVNFWWGLLKLVLYPLYLVLEPVAWFLSHPLGQGVAITVVLILAAYGLSKIVEGR